MNKPNPSTFTAPPHARFIFSDSRMAWLWLLIRVGVGYEWLSAGLQKWHSDIWIGSHGGQALTGFLLAALKKTTGAHPDVSSWYAWCMTNIALPHTQLFSYLVTYGEILVGIALILGAFTGIAAFFGAFMNTNYLLAGTVSINPQLLILEFLLLLAWRVAGWWGVDRIINPALYSSKNSP